MPFQGDSKAIPDMSPALEWESVYLLYMTQDSKGTASVLAVLSFLE